MAQGPSTERESLDLDDLLAEETLPFESGTRRIARTDGRGEESGEDSENLDGRRESQRPTFRVPVTAGLAGYLDAPPRIDSELPRSQESLAEMLAMLEREPTIEEEPTLQASLPLPPPPEEEEPPTLVRFVRSTLLPPPFEPETPPVVHVPSGRTDTMRVRLTPYAREHAIADGNADDTPAEMLRYLKLLGSFDRLPYVSASMRDVMLAKLDHREGFVLSLVDGRSDIDTILDACPMPTHKTLRILHGLYVRGILGLR